MVDKPTVGTIVAVQVKNQMYQHLKTSFYNPKTFVFTGEILPAERGDSPDHFG